MDVSEAQLIERLKNGDEDAFRELVDLYSELLLRVALRHVSRRSDAEDLVQETFEAACTGIAKFEGRSTLKSWLVGILYRRAARHHRSAKSKKREVLVDSIHEEAGIDHVANHDAAPSLLIDAETIIESLSEEHRTVIVLREIEGLSYREIAEALQIPNGTVESRLFRAKQHIRKAFANYFVHRSPDENPCGVEETRL